MAEAIVEAAGDDHEPYRLIRRAGSYASSILAELDALNMYRLV